jgi:RecB family exonuclease
LERIEKRSQGWETPLVFNFNRWVKNILDMLWEPSRSLSKLGALRLWHEAAQKMKPLEGLNLTPSLYLELQEAFDVLTSHGQKLIGYQTSQIFPTWRQNVSRHFLGLLQAHQYVSWADVLDIVGKAVAQGKISLPKNIIFTGFDELSPIEKNFVHIVSEKSHVVFYRAKKEPGEEVKVQVYATPEQECQSICTEVLKAWNGGQKRLGVVFLDTDYFQLLKRCFEELADREVRPANALRYNLTMGIALSEHPLFQTAMFPLRLLEEPTPNTLLSSLLCSPYIRKQRDDWDHQVKIALWSTNGAQTLNDALINLTRLGFPTGSLEIFATEQKQPMEVWLEGIENLWKELDFPLCRCETDTLAKEHLFKVLEELRKETGYLEVSRKDVLDWFIAASEGIEVVEKTPETAGIQVLNRVEVRGLSFDCLWVVGTHGRVLPEPVRNLPFLDPDERRIVEGGTEEGRWEAGKRTVSYFLAAAPTVTFSRAASRAEDEPYIPCPLIPDESPKEGQFRTVDLWENPPQGWVRARWLREGMAGFSSQDAEVRGEVNDRVNTSLPQVLNVTNLEEILSCPFRYFAGSLLSLESLQEPVMRITPLERGEVIHRILRDLIRGLITAAPDWPMDSRKAFEFLKQTAEAVLAAKPDNLFWKVERLRLLGDDTFPGLLSVWLEEEQERALEGWRFEVAEERFEGLIIGDSGVILTGQVDRIDSHPLHGMIIWDYKTGDVPTSTAIFKDKVAPQLPAYLLALMRSLLHHVDASDRTVMAGYIHLKKASEVKIVHLKDARQWQEFLSQWESAVKERLEHLLSGLYLPDPRPSPGGNQKKGACKNCDYLNLCNYHDTLERDEGETEDDLGEV